MTRVGPTELGIAGVVLMMMTACGLLLPRHAMELLLAAHTEVFLNAALNAFGCW
jgi:hypothetical protein